MPPSGPGERFSLVKANYQITTHHFLTSFPALCSFSSHLTLPAHVGLCRDFSPTFQDPLHLVFHGVWGRFTESTQSIVIHLGSRSWPEQKLWFENFESSTWTFLDVIERKWFSLISLEMSSLNSKLRSQRPYFQFP